MVIKNLPWFRDRPVIQAIALIAAAAFGGIGTAVLTKPAVPPAVQQAEAEFTAPLGMGWVNDPEAVKAVENTLPVGQKRFEDTPAGRVFRQAGDGPTVMLSDVVKRVRGSHLPARNQRSVGSCVSFGTASAVEYLMYEQVAAGDALQFRDLAQEVIYGGSRVEVGGGRIRGDGSVTAWAGQFVQKWGVVPRGKYAGVDLSEYDEATCRTFGRNGVPPELETVARESPVKGITFARTATEVEKAIRQGYTVAVGSAVGFGNRGPYTRDADGFLRASGSWGHCMAVIGVRGGSRPGFLFLNSWGPDWVRGPTGGLDMPPGSFWVDSATAGRMFGEGDCVVFSDAVGFPAIPLDWFAGVVPARRSRDVVRLPGAEFALGF